MKIAVVEAWVEAPLRRYVDEARARLGAAFSLQRFHDALLSHGAPPIALIHDEVLRELGK